MSALPVKIKDLSFSQLEQNEMAISASGREGSVVDVEFDSQGMAQSSHSSSPNVQASCFSFL